MRQPDPVMESYDQLAMDYDRRWRTYEDATLHATLEGISCRQAERLLDVACGTGELERIRLARCPAL